MEILLPQSGNAPGAGDFESVHCGRGADGSGPDRRYSDRAGQRGATRDSRANARGIDCAGNSSIRSAILQAAHDALAAEIAPIDDMRSTARYRRASRGICCEFLNFWQRRRCNYATRDPRSGSDRPRQASHDAGRRARRRRFIFARGIIAAITGYAEIPAGATVHEAGDYVVMPGIVDTHVHINEPGRTEWEGFSTATRAAAAGGVTTLIEMPLNSIPATTTAAAFREKLAAAAGKLWVDVGFWGGVVPGNPSELRRSGRQAFLASNVFWCRAACMNFRM